MQFSLLSMGIALIAGMTMAVQGSLNSALGKKVGLWEATFIVHLIAVLAMVVLLFIFRVGKGNLGDFTTVPWYIYIGGLLGVVITLTVAMSIPKLGVAVATTGIIVGQVSTACLVDHLGLFGLEPVHFSWPKAVGIILLAAGARFMLIK